MTNSDTYAAPAAATGFPLLAILAAFPIACFCCALATDIVYQQTANVMWADFSAWLLAVGIIIGVIAAIVGLVMLIANRRTPRPRSIWPVVVGAVIVFALALVDNLVHSRDAWTSVVWLGLALSAATVVVMLITAWLGFARVSRPVGAVSYAGVRR